MDDYADYKQHIKAHLFQKVGPNGAPEQTYVAHLKIWEPDPGQPHMKARFIILARESPE